MKFIKKHKIITTVLVVIILIITVSFATAYHFLNKINYDDGGTSIETAPTAEVSTEESDILNSGSLSDNEKQSLSVADKSIGQNLDNSQIWYSSDVLNILLMGIDYGGKAYPYGRSDAMIVLSINKVSKKIHLVSLSRAAYVAIKGYNNTRLNHAHGYGGAPLAVSTVESNYKIRIDNYASVTFDSFEKIIDALGGVKINLTAAEARVLNRKYGKFPSAGTYSLNGNQALEYVRIRKIDTDKERTSRQRKLLLSISQKIKSMNLSSVGGILNTVLPLVTTDFSKSDILKQAANLSGYLDWDISQAIVPHKSSSLVLRGGFEVLLVNWQDEVKYVHDLLYNNADVKYDAA